MLKLNNGVFRTDEPLDVHSTLKVGGTCRYYFEPESESALAESVCLATENGIPYFVVGGGSNVFFSDHGFDGMAIKLNHKIFQKCSIDKGNVDAGAGLPLSSLLKNLIQNNLGDCEFLYGIPASLGGAICMNAGSSSRWIGEKVTTVRCMDDHGSVTEVSREACGFAYRSSALGGRIILSAKLKFPEVDAEITRKQIELYALKRRKTQDLTSPSSGCMFRNPSDDCRSAGELIDKAGLKGVRMGGAMVSEVHANFLMNVGHASSKDVSDLLDHVSNTVFHKFQIRLEREMKFIGELQ